MRKGNNNYIPSGEPGVEGVSKLSLVFFKQLCQIDIPRVTGEADIDYKMERRIQILLEDAHMQN